MDNELLTIIISQICDYAVEHDMDPDDTLRTVASNILAFTEIATCKGWVIIMSNMYERKRLFVEYDLADLLQAIDDHILGCEYQVSDNRSMEICTIVWANGSKRVVNVTGDSLLAIAKDVLKYME